MPVQKPDPARPPLLSVAQALDFLLAAADAQPLLSEPPEVLPTIAAHGRVLALAQASTLNVPPMDNTQMDGYAVRAADCADGAARLRVAQRIPAGQVGTELLPGTAARIFTGAMIPPGADAVVMQEACQAAPAGADGVAQVTVRHVPAVGEWIRRTGEDIRAGDTILAAGTRLRAQELGLAASVGLDSLPVVRKLRVAVFFTGDELAMPGEPLKPGAIYNSNRFLLRGLLDNPGWELTDLGIVPDTLEATRATLRAAAREHDLIITSGGVSVGEEDHIRPAVEAEGRLNLWQIAVKPGKPLAFGEIRRGDAASGETGRADEGGVADGTGGRSDDSIGAGGRSGISSVTSGTDIGLLAPGQDRPAFFLGLPGNPVSSFVTFLLFVRPFMLRLQGVREVQPRSFQMRADFAWARPDRRNEFLRARINDAGGLDLFANQGSGVLTSTVWGDGLIDNPPHQAIAPGDLVRFLPFSDLLA